MPSDGDGNFSGSVIFNLNDIMTLDLVLFNLWLKLTGRFGFLGDFCVDSQEHSAGTTLDAPNHHQNVVEGIAVKMEGDGDNPLPVEQGKDEKLGNLRVNSCRDLDGPNDLQLDEEGCGVYSTVHGWYIYGK